MTTRLHQRCASAPLRLAMVWLLAALSISCVNNAPVLDSIAHRTFEGTPRKVFVECYFGHELPEPFQEGYVAGLEREWQELGAAVSVAKLTGLELDRTAHVKMREAFAPDLQLTARLQVHRVTSGYYRGEIILALLDPRAQVVYWEAVQSFGVSDFAVPDQSQFDAGLESAAAAFQKLLQDGVLAQIRRT